MQDKIIKSLISFNPLSIFLYGSRGRGDYKEDSDYEVGIIFEDEKILKRSFIHERINLDSVAVYPFKLSDVTAGNFNNPFVDSIYARELVEGAKTIYGRKIIENINPPKITTLDLLRLIRFEIGCAFTAVLAHRNGDLKIPNEGFSKSCLFGLRLLIILREREFICSPDGIYKRGRQLELETRYLQVIEDAYLVRAQKQKLKADMTFDNLAFLDLIESEIMQELELNGNSEII